MATGLPPPPRKEDARFDNWVFTLWKRAVAALVSGGVGVTTPITITTSGTGTINIGHGTSGVVTGTYGSQSSIPIVAVDTYGHITFATSSAVAISGTNITGADLNLTTPIIFGTGTGTNILLRSALIAHATSGAIPATYGNQSSVPILTVNTYGHVTLATSSAINIVGTAVTGSDLTISAPLVGTATNALLRAGTIGHGTSGVTTGTYGGPASWLAVNVDTYGHVRAVSTFAPTGTAITGADVTATTPILLSGTSTNAALRPFSIAHATSGAIPATYGNQSSVPILTVDTYGHVTAGTSSAILVNGTAVTGADLTISSPLVGTATNALLRAGTVGHGTSGVIGGVYGGAGGIPSVTVNTWGHVTAGTSFPLQATTPILVGSNAGTYTFGHSTSGVTTGTYGAGNALLAINVDTFGHVRTVTTFALSGTGITGADISATTPILVSGTTTNAVLRPFSITHATSGIVPGTFGAASVIPQVVVDTYGHVTAINTFGLTGTAVSGADVSVTAPITVSGTSTNAVLRPFTIAHGTSGAIPGTYGGTFGIPRVIVDTYGHVTAGTSFPLQATAPILAGSNAGTFTLGHSTSGITAAAYGGTAGLPSVTVDTFGHVTAASSLLLQATSPILVGSNAGTYTWGHSTSGIVSGTYGGSGVSLQVVVNTWGHVTAASTFGIDAGNTDYPMVKGSVPDGTSVTIPDGYQLLCVEMTVFGTGTMIVQGTGILAIL